MTTPSDLKRALDDCLARDRHALLSRIRQWEQRRRDGKSADRLAAELEQAVARSRARVAERRASLPQPEFDPALPVNQRLDDLRAAIERHQVVIVCGETGSGKTTQLLKLAETYPDAVFLAEDAHLFETTVRDNLLVARGDATDDEIRSALRRVGLGQWLDGLPDGLSTVLVGGAAAVSAGQRRRLLLARALLTTAPIVLLDEPTEHLDAADGSRILTELLTPGGLFPAERTVVIATHHLPQRVTSAA